MGQAFRRAISGLPVVSSAVPPVIPVKIYGHTAESKEEPCPEARNKEAQQEPNPPTQEDHAVKARLDDHVEHEAAKQQKDSPGSHV